MWITEDLPTNHEIGINFGVILGAFGLGRTHRELHRGNLFGGHPRKVYFCAVHEELVGIDNVTIEMILLQRKSAHISCTAPKRLSLNNASLVSSLAVLLVMTEGRLKSGMPTPLVGRVANHMRSAREDLRSIVGDIDFFSLPRTSPEA